MSDQSSELVEIQLHTVPTTPSQVFYRGGGVQWRRKFTRDTSLRRSSWSKIVVSNTLGLHRT